MRNSKRLAIATAAASLLTAMLGSFTAHADNTPTPPPPPHAMLQFHGQAADMTKAAAETAAMADAAANEKQFTDHLMASCADKSSAVESHMVAMDQYLAFATITSDCTLPAPPVQPAS